MCRKQKKGDPLMGSLSSKRNQTSTFLHLQALLTGYENCSCPSSLATLGCRPIGVGQIFALNFPQKNSGWGGGGGEGCVITLAPHYYSDYV